MSQNAESEKNGDRATIHELRNALNTISTIVQSLAHDLSTPPGNLYQLLCETIADLKAELDHIEAFAQKLQNR